MKLDDYSQGLRHELHAAGERFVITRESFPGAPPGQLESDARARWAFRWYDEHPVESVVISLTAETSIALGSAVVAALLWQSEIKVEFADSHRDRVITTLVIEAPPHARLGAIVDIRQFSYALDSADAALWIGCLPDPRSYPRMRLTNAQRHVYRDADVMAREVLVGFGTVSGMTYIAEVLFDLGRGVGGAKDVRLESECGTRGVAPGSVELVLALEGSDYFDLSSVLQGTR